MDNRKTAKELFALGIITRHEYNKILNHEKFGMISSEPGVELMFKSPALQVVIPEFTQKTLIDDREQIKQHYEKELDLARKVIIELSGQISTLTKDNEEFADGLIEQEETIEKLRAEIAKLKGTK